MDPGFFRDALPASALSVLVRRDSLNLAHAKYPRIQVQSIGQDGVVWQRCPHQSQRMMRLSRWTNSASVIVPRISAILLEGWPMMRRASEEE